MRDHPSVPERFVTVWARVQAMPEFDLKDSRRFVFSEMRRIACDNIARALDEAERLAVLGQRIAEDSAPKVDA